MSCTDCSNTINTLPIGSAGLDGASAYIYVATATNSSGANFALYADSPTQCWKAILVSPTEITSPQASDFADLWFNTCGTNGSNGTNGTNGREGVDGNIWLYGSSNPSTLSNDGDLYLNTTSGYVWEQQEGAWVNTGGTLKGPAGTNGTDGENGITWTSGNIDPNSGADGVTIGDLYFNADTGGVYRWNGSSWDIISNIMGPQGEAGATGATGATGAQGDPSTITSNDATVTVTPITGGFDLSIKHELDTFTAFIVIGEDSSSTSESFPVVSTSSCAGIADGGKKIADYPSTYIYYNNSNVTSSTITTNFGTFNRSTGVFTTSVEGTFLLSATIHLKPDNSTSDNWSDNPGLFGLAFCPSANDTDIICGEYQTVNALTKHIDLTIQRVCHLNSNYGIILKALNWTDRNYNGSSYANSDGISFTITKLH